MKSDFWHERWQNGEIAFHEVEGNAFLKQHLKVLGLSAGSRVFVPLCGKTRDIAWLLAKGYRVVGVELSRVAIEQLFEELGVTPEIETRDSLMLYRAPDIEIWVGDFFELNAGMMRSVDAVYDRAALVALPDEMRMRYAWHLVTLSDAAPQLLVAFDYDQSKLDGPPFSVNEPMIRDCYADTYSLRLLEQAAVPGGLKGKVDALNTVWELLPVRNA